MAFAVGALARRVEWLHRHAKLAEQFHLAAAFGRHDHVSIVVTVAPLVWLLAVLAVVPQAPHEAVVAHGQTGFVRSGTLGEQRRAQVVAELHCRIVGVVLVKKAHMAARNYRFRAVHAGLVNVRV